MSPPIMKLQPLLLSASSVTFAFSVAGTEAGYPGVTESPESVAYSTSTSLRPVTETQTAGGF